jgi:hypothetical protein
MIFTLKSVDLLPQCVHILTVLSNVFLALHVLCNYLQSVARSIHTPTDYTVCSIRVSHQSDTGKSFLPGAKFLGCFVILADKDLAENLLHYFSKFLIVLNQVNREPGLALS